MAFQKLNFCVTFFLVAFVWSSLSETNQCGKDEDCRNQLACIDDDFYSFDFYSTFCYEGRCYCEPWYSRCWKDEECPRYGEGCPNEYKDKCVRGTCVCSKESGSPPSSPPPAVPEPLPSPAPSPVDDAGYFEDQPFY